MASDSWDVGGLGSPFGQGTHALLWGLPWGAMSESRDGERRQAPASRVSLRLGPADKCGCGDRSSRSWRPVAQLGHSTPRPGARYRLWSGPGMSPAGARAGVTGSVGP